MIYRKVVEGSFLERENRFVARVLLPEAGAVRVHVKNTGRCRELLVPGTKVYLEDHIDRMGNRKYRYSLIAVEKQRSSGAEAGNWPSGAEAGSVPGIAAGGVPDIAAGSGLPGTGSGTLLINMDSQAPNRVTQEALEEGRLQLPGFPGEGCRIRPETTYGRSRFDFFLEPGPTAGEAEGNESAGASSEEEPGPTAGEAEGNESAGASSGAEPAGAFLEVKGVTLETDGIARFPDAPTERGVKHINELVKAAEDGYRAYILFVIQMKGIRWFEPNDETHPAFGEALRQAKEAGVEILAMDCRVTGDRLTLDQPVPVRL